MLGRIGVHLDSDVDCERRVRTAAGLAERHHADLVGIYASFRHPQCYIDKFGLPVELVTALERTESDTQHQVQAMLARETERHRLHVLWRTEQGMPEDILAKNARYCDVLLMSQPTAQDPAPQQMYRLLAAVVMAVGRPVIVVPAAGQIRTPGERVLLCWDQSREAARAFADAAPILEAATELTVLIIDPQSRPLFLTPANREDLFAYCARRGFPVPHIAEHRSGNFSVANTILNTASETGADLIVMGAYGYSRLQAAILGGTTRKVLEEMQVPVLFSH